MEPFGGAFGLRIDAHFWLRFWTAFWARFGDEKRPNTGVLGDARVGPAERAGRLRLKPEGLRLEP